MTSYAINDVLHFFIHNWSILPPLTPFTLSSPHVPHCLCLLSCSRHRTLNAKANEIWKEDNIPTFHGNVKTLKRLDIFLASVYQECSYEEVGFDYRAMRRHVLNHFTERRRRVTRGHSYKLPDRRSTKGQKHPGQLYIYKCV